MKEISHPRQIAKRKDESVQTLVSIWFTRSQDTILYPDIFDRFICLWIAFDAWGCNLSGSIERGMIRWVAEKDSRFPQLFEVHLKEIAPTIRKLIEMKPVPNHRNGEEITISDEKSFAQVIDAICQIRNNLFHGYKNPGDLEDRSYVQCAYDIMSPLMQDLVTSFGLPVD